MKQGHLVYAGSTGTAWSKTATSNSSVPAGGYISLFTAIDTTPSNGPSYRYYGFSLR